MALMPLSSEEAGTTIFPIRSKAPNRLFRVSESYEMATINTQVRVTRHHQCARRPLQLGQSRSSRRTHAGYIFDHEAREWITALDAALDG
jgi:hypothetical protein